MEKTWKKRHLFYLSILYFFCFFALTWNDNGPKHLFFPQDDIFAFIGPLIWMDLLKPFFGVGFWQVSLKTPGLDQGLSYPCQFRDIALMSWPGLPNFYAWATRHVINFGCCKKDFPDLPQLASPFQGRLSQKVGEEAIRPCWAWVRLNALANLSLSQPLRTQAGIGMVHPPRMSVSSHRAKHDAVVICGHTWSWCSPVSSKTWACVCVFFFSLHFPPGPQALFAQVLECRRDGCAKGSRCEGSGSRRCQGFQRFWRVAIQWGLAVGDATLCWYRINCIYTIITFCGHSCQPPAGKLGKKNKWTILRSTVLQPPLDSLAGQRLVSAIL